MGLGTHVEQIIVNENGQVTKYCKYKLTKSINKGWLSLVVITWAESKYTVTFINRNDIINIFQNKCSF